MSLIRLLLIILLGLEENGLLRSQRHSALWVGYCTCRPLQPVTATINTQAGFFHLSKSMRKNLTDDGDKKEEKLLKL